MTRPSRRHQTGALVLTAAALVMTGCKSDDPIAVPPTTTVPTTAAPATTPPPTTATTVPFAQITPGSPEDKAAVLNTLDSFWKEFLPATDPPDPERPTLFALVTGVEAIETHTDLQKMKEAGQRSRRPSSGPIPHAAGEPTINGNKAVVFECILNDKVLYDSSGKVVNNDAVLRSYKSELSRSSTGWVVYQRWETAEEGSHPTCAGLHS